MNCKYCLAQMKNISPTIYRCKCGAEFLAISGVWINPESSKHQSEFLL
jgi:hypothetical protein